MSGWDVTTGRIAEVLDPGRGMTRGHQAVVGGRAAGWPARRSSRSSSGGWAPDRSWTDSGPSTGGRWRSRPGSASSRRCARRGAGTWSPAASASPLPLRTATAAYYRSQFLNTALPGGVLGDVDRAVRHGSAAGDVGPGPAGRRLGALRRAGRAARARAGRAAAAAVPGADLGSWSWWRSRSSARSAADCCCAAGRRAERSRGARALRAAATDIRDGLLARRAWPGIALASVVVVAGHLATLLLAARTAGATAPTVQLLPLAMLVLLATAVPTNIGGWGPREGMAAWAFGAAGLGAAQGVATATVYAVLSLAATSRRLRCSSSPGSGAADAISARPSRRRSRRRAVEGRDLGSVRTSCRSRPAGWRLWLSVPTPC